ALARAIVARPQILLMDEPFSRLDPQLRKRVRQEIKNLILNSKISCLMVSHDLEDAFDLADRIGVIKDGKLLQWDSPEVIFNQPKTPYVAEYMGPCNFASIKVLSDSTFRYLSTEFVTEQNLQLHKNWNLLIRPNHIKIQAQGKNQGHIEELKFHGSHVWCKIKTSDHHCISTLTDADHNYNLGQKVCFDIDIAKPIIY
ncbi:MAG: TOBE domain-containing protein, partial [Pseudobdellovibrionaceae bacterium]